MTTCIATLNSSFLAFPRNLGVSPGAEVIERQARELQDISDQSVTIGGHLREIMKRLHGAARESSVDNWDRYGAKAVDPRSLFRAIRFARMLTINVPTPDIYVDPEGEIVFEWYFGPRRVFNVTARKNGELAYAGLVGVNKACGVVQMDDELPEVILDNVFKVSSETGYSCS